jgi:hypothetical protein
MADRAVMDVAATAMPATSQRQERCLSKVNCKTPVPQLCYDVCVNWRQTAGVRLMNKLVEIRNQEFICRERALLDSEHRIFWLAKAEEWAQRALDEIAFHFRECNPDRLDFQTAAH